MSGEFGKNCKDGALGSVRKAADSHFYRAEHLKERDKLFSDHGRRMVAAWGEEQRKIKGEKK